MLGTLRQTTDLIPYTIYNMTATFRLKSVHFCVYLDVSDECSIIHKCTNFPKSGATSKLYTQNGWADASSIQEPTNIKCYYTKYARIHQTQVQVFHTFHDFQKYKFLYAKITLLHIYMFQFCTKKIKWILSFTVDINHFIPLQARFSTHIIIHIAYKMSLSGSVFHPLYVQPFPDWNISWNPACFWIGNIEGEGVEHSTFFFFVCRQIN